MQHPIYKELESLASKTAIEHGFKLCNLQVLAHQNPITMQVQIRPMKGGDVSLDDCARFSGPMGDALETSNLIDQAYVLEISSPGISDNLVNERDYETFRGFPVEVTFKDEKDSEHRQIGLLNEKSNDHVQLNIKGKMNRIPLKRVIGVRLTTQTG